MSPDIAYLARCAALRHRGLTRDLVHQLQEAHNEVLLGELEDAPDAALVELSDLYRTREAQAAALGAAVSAVVLLGVAAGLRAAPLLWEGDDS